MKKFVLDYICLLEGYKTSIKSLHWDARNLPQHQLCDDIASEISDFQDLVAEIEQALDGNLAFNKLEGTKYTIKDLKSFVKDVIKKSTDFYHQLEKQGDDYIGMRSECETFLATMQRKLYLVNFTLNEAKQRENKKKINEERFNRFVNNIITREIKRITK